MRLFRTCFVLLLVGFGIGCGGVDNSEVKATAADPSDVGTVQAAGTTTRAARAMPASSPTGFEKKTMAVD